MISFTSHHSEPSKIAVKVEKHIPLYWESVCARRVKVLLVLSFLAYNSIITILNTKAQYGGAHFNVLIKNPAKDESPAAWWTNESGLWWGAGGSQGSGWWKQNMKFGFYQRIEAARINTSFHHWDMKTEELRRENIFLGFKKTNICLTLFRHIFIVNITFCLSFHWNY